MSKSVSALKKMNARLMRKVHRDGCAPSLRKRVMALKRKLQAERVQQAEAIKALRSENRILKEALREAYNATS